MQTKTKFFVSTLVITGLLIFIYYTYVLNIEDQISKYEWIKLSKVITYPFLAVTVSSFILLFFSNEVFKLWKKRILLLIIPVALLFIVTGSDGVNVVWPTRADFALLFGELLVLLTLIFALVQKFYYKR